MVGNPQVSFGFDWTGGNIVNKSPIRVLVVEDCDPWRRYFSTALQKQPELQVIGEVSDGLEAVQQAEELQPDLILLDIGLPTLNGIEAARRIRKVSPASRILFVSENRSADIAEEALSTGASGYVVKSDAESELLPAVKAVLQSKQFVSASLMGHDSNAPKDDHAAAIRHCHEVAFHADDDSVVDGYARFIESALKSGNAVIVVVTEAHRASLLPRLEADGVDVAAAIKQGSYVPLDPADALVRLTVNDMPDPVRSRKVIGDLVMGAAKGVKGEHGQVVVCGEIAPTLLSKGNAEGAIKLEHLWDEITKGYGVHTLCGYLWSAFPDRESSPIFRRICGEHSAVHGREQGY
jgi:DNA-binding NarL/FixJ family response regulator